MSDNSGNPRIDGEGSQPKMFEQLEQIATNYPAPNSNRGPSRGQNVRGQGQRPGRGTRYQPFDDNNRHQVSRQPQTQAWNDFSNSTQNNVDAFPPLGPFQPQTQYSNYQPVVQHHRQQHGPNYTHRDYNTSQTQSRQPQYNVQHQTQRQHPQPYHQPPQVQGFVEDSRSRGRGGAYRGGQNFHRQNQQYQPHVHRQQDLVNTNDFSRPPVNAQNRIFTPGMNPHAGTAEQQRAFRHKIMSQSDYLASIASQSLKNQMTPEEAQSKEAFRKKLQTMAQQAIADTGGPEVESLVENVKLRLYGSLGSGFGIAGSDMDLLLTFPQNDGPLREIEIISRRTLEKAILSAGYGARLLTNTRVPILKVCELPSAGLLQNLRDYREKWEEEEEEERTNENSTVNTSNGLLPSLSDDQMSVATQAFGLLDMNAADVPLPASPVLDHAKLDFTGECGIQCDINFSNYVALQNTELLKTYGHCDGRVRQIGIFVKNWAKARDINTPYRGTLSSYGYIMMVLHYLMNIVNPPLIPNLQQIAKDDDVANGNTVVEIVEGCDVRFVRNHERLQAIMQRMPKNHESLGSLLRGFFWYYAVPQGFHYNRDAISIRTKGGCISKRDKGWTEAKWSERHVHVRLRYLLAIEDPFELDHNIGRTVGHHGIVSIRDEFRRAWSMIDTVYLDSTKNQWYWDNKGEQQSAEDFMAPAENRGDLLRQDQNFHKDKIRRMRQEAEAKEQALKQEVLDDDVSTEETKQNGTWTSINSECPPDIDFLNQSDLPSTQLIHNRSFQGKNEEWKSRPMRRQRRIEDDENDVEDTIIVTKVEAPAEMSQDWENQVDSQAYMTSEKDMWGDGNDAWNSIAPKVNTSKNFNWEGEPEVGNTTVDSEWVGQETSSEALPSESSDALPSEPVSTEAFDQKCDVQSYSQSDCNTDQVDESRSDDVQSLESSDHPESSEEIIKQRQDHISIMGTRAFARNRNATVILEPHNRNSNANKKVGHHILWDDHTEGGRWLKWRDRHIHAGAFSEPRLQYYKDLDKRFPYNPHMTYAELAVMNAELRKHYRDGLVPVYPQNFPPSKKTEESADLQSESPVARTQGQGKIFDLDTQQAHADSLDKSPLLTDASEGRSEDEQSPTSSLKVQPARLSDNDLTDAENSSTLSREQVRERRLMYYAQQTSRSSTKNDTSDAEGYSIVQQKDSQAPHQPPNGRKDSGFSSVLAKKGEREIIAETVSATQMSEDYDEHERSIADHQQKLLSLLNVSSSKTVGPQVPLTLYPDVPNDQRPRDEDPDIMPIPRKLGFVFDPRQLEDLHKIKLGGNGCARKGEEFNIEEDYDWGGGGAMGYKSSSGVLHSGTGRIRRASSWHGRRSDGLRLLDELPGFV